MARLEPQKPAERDEVHCLRLKWEQLAVELKSLADCYQGVEELSYWEAQELQDIYLLVSLPLYLLLLLHNEAHKEGDDQLVLKDLKILVLKPLKQGQYLFYF